MKELNQLIAAKARGPHPSRCGNSDPAATLCAWCGGELLAEGR